jgi:hypothetical protein
MRHMTEAAARDVADAEQRDIEIVEKLFRAWAEHAAYGSERHAAGGPLKEPHAGRRLELFDAPAQRGLRNIHRLRCFAEAAQLHDGTKRLQVVQVEVGTHGRFSVFWMPLFCKILIKEPIEDNTGASAEHLPQGSEDSPAFT